MVLFSCDEEYVHHWCLVRNRFAKNTVEMYNIQCMLTKSAEKKKQRKHTQNQNRRGTNGYQRKERP